MLVEFGNKVQNLRKRKGLSQEKFALQINMDRTYFASVEAGRRNISLLNIEKIAKGFEISISELFEGVGEIEAHHEERYKKLLYNVENGRVFKRDEPKQWICMECGEIYYGEEPPEECPVCEHPIAHREIWVENY